MTINPYGAVQVHDFGAPKYVTAKARETVSGGCLVFFSGATAKVSSGADSFAEGDIEVCSLASGAAFNGLAMNKGGSEAYITVATEGVFILPCHGSVFAGYHVECNGVSGTVAALGSHIVPVGTYGPTPASYVIGRAMTAGASGGFAVIHLRA